MIPWAELGKDGLGLRARMGWAGLFFFAIVYPIKRAWSVQNIVCLQ